MERPVPRVSLDPRSFDRRPGLLTRGVLRYVRRTYGGELDTISVMAHHGGVLVPWTLLEGATKRTRSVLPEHLADLVVFVAATRLGCSWCVDFGASLWERKGLDPNVLRAAVSWRDSDVFDDDQRAAFAYTELVCGDVGSVDDAMTADLVERFGEAGLVELTYWVALENMRSRFNAALGLSSQGFSSGEACALAAVRRSAG